MLRNQICKFLSFHCRLQGRMPAETGYSCLFQEQQQRVAPSSSGSQQSGLRSSGHSCSSVYMTTGWSLSCNSTLYAGQDEWSDIENKGSAHVSLALSDVSHLADCLLPVLTDLAFDLHTGEICPTFPHLWHVAPLNLHWSLLCFPRPHLSQFLAGALESLCLVTFRTVPFPWPFISLAFLAAASMLIAISKAD